MNLTHSQKKYIKKNLKKRKLSEIANHLKISEDSIINFIKKKSKGVNYQKFVEKNLNEKKIFSFHRVDWIKKNKSVLILLSVAVFAAYFNSLNNNFVSDDNGIVQNAPLWSFDSIISQPLYLLRQLIYIISYKFFGLNPFVFRSFNILFHLGSVILIYLLLDLLIDKRVAFFSALIFAVHPILIESVSWISGGVYAQYSFFFLLSFIFYILYRNIEKRSYYIFSLIFFSFSLLSSEKAFVLFLIFFLFEISNKGFKKNWKKTLPYFILSLILIILYFGKVGQRITSLQTEFYQDQVSQIDNPLIQIPIAITSYLQLIFWPQNLTIYHSEMSFSQTEYLIRLSIFILFSIFIFYGYKRNRQIFFWLSFFVITLLPTLTPLKISWIVAERYVYLGSLGIFVIIAKAFKKLSEIKNFKMGVYMVFTLIIVVLLTRTIVRNVDWKNEDNLWIATGKTSPSSPNNHNNLGDVYGRQGDFQRAVLEFKKAIEIKPNYADAYHNLANTYVEIKKYEEAVKNYQKAIYFNPKLWQSYQNLAVLYFQNNQFSPALENIQKAIAINPENINLQADLGVIYYRMGDKNKAKAIFAKLLKIDPNNEKIKSFLSELSKEK